MTEIYLTLHTQRLKAKINTFVLMAKNIKINKNIRQFLSQMDSEKCTFATWLKLSLILAPQKSL